MSEFYDLDKEETLYNYINGADDIEFQLVTEYDEHW